jgi:hypothetical protein
MIGTDVLEVQTERTNRRWGSAVRKALNKLVRCHEESKRQQARIARVLAFAEKAFAQLKAEDEQRKRCERRARSN